MDCLTLLNPLWFLATSLLDIVSDFSNSLSFLYSDFRVLHIIPGITSNLVHTGTHKLATNNTANESTTIQPTGCIMANCSNSTEEPTYYETAPHLIWGSIGMLLIFCPGMFALIFAILSDRPYDMFCKQEKGTWCCITSLFWSLFLLCYPLVIVVAGVATIFTGTNKLFGDSDAMGWAPGLVVFAAFESYFQSVPQLILQIFSLLNRYPLNGLQLLTILTSALMILKTGIELDLKAAEEEVGDKSKRCRHLIRIIPLNISALLFRTAAITLTATYLRYWAIIPITLSLLETCVIVAFCIRLDATLMFFVAISSVGGTNTGMTQLMDYFFDEVTISTKVKKFANISNIITFFHHTITLIIILILIVTFPTLMNHWTDDTLIPDLMPSHYHFIFIFNNVFSMGIINLLLSLYPTSIV